MSILQLPTPRVFAPLLAPSRYKGAYGGRGSGKSHFFAELLVEEAVRIPGLRAVCIREVQNSIRDSVRQLIVDKVARYGLEDRFQVLETEIRTPHGGTIIFRGMQNFNAENIKSLEGYDRAWVEEAQTLSDRSLRMLRPTIRKPGSELWFSWNPRHDTDPVDVLFRGGNPPEGTISVQANWQDNPWFPAELKAEMRRDYAADEEMAAHVWGGHYEIITEGAYYARALAQAEADGRIGEFPHRAHLPVHTSWDIGVDDYTAIWFWQEDGENATVIDYHETSGEGAQQIVDDALPEHGEDARAAARRLIELGRARPWRYGRHYLPHDVKMREWGQGARSRVETLMGLGLRGIIKGAALGPEERIAASRKLLPLVRFHDTPRVRVGLTRLRRYSRRWNDNMSVWQGPLHDENSHGADAFGEFAVNCPLIVPDVVESKRVQPVGTVFLPGEPEEPARWQRRAL